MEKVDNTVLTNGIVIDNQFFPKRNLPSGTLRIVLTTECNYQCIYCFAEGEIDKCKRILDLEDIKKILMISKEFGITSIKLTGGEPLLYPKIKELLSYLKEELQFPYVDLTTNISLLNEKNIKMLNQYKVNSLTLSLNTLKEEKFKKLSKFSNYPLVMNNLQRTIHDFKGNIRINCIVFDEDYDPKDYDAILSLCKENGLGLRLVEPSKVEGFPITEGKAKFSQYVNNLRLKADKVISSDCKSVEYFFFDNWYLTIMHSLCDNTLCDSCTNYMYIRLTSERKLKPCLSRRDTEVDVDVSSDQKIREAFYQAISNMGVGLLDEVK